MKVTIDSRQIEPGDIFIPVKGKHVDGHDFIAEAVKKGAKVLDVDLYKYAKQYRKKLSCKVIGITGSSGKTTVKDLLYAILSKKYNVVRTHENQNNEIGAPLTLLQADHLTDIVLVEMGMRHLGDIRYLASCIKPTHAIITNIGKTHLELLKTQKNIAKAKAELFTPALKWESYTRVAYLNHKTPYYELLKNQALKTNFSIYPFEGKDKPEENINLCYLVARHFGLTNDEIQAGIDAYKPSEHRLISHKKNNITFIDDTYNSNPDGLQYALDYLKRFSGRKILVLGDMLELGDNSKEEHMNCSQLALEAGVSCLFTVGELTAAIPDKPVPHLHFDSKEDLIETLKAELKDGDIILVKGSRGTKMEDVFNAVGL